IAPGSYNALARAVAGLEEYRSHTREAKTSGAARAYLGLIEDACAQLSCVQNGCQAGGGGGQPGSGPDTPCSGCSCQGGSPVALMDGNYTPSQVDLERPAPG